MSTNTLTPSPSTPRPLAPAAPPPAQVFAQEYRKTLREKYPTTDNKEISKMLGQKWKGLTPPQKSKYVLPFKSRKAAL